MSESRMYPGTSQEERTSFAPYSAFDIPADLRELHGRYDVEATARRVRNFRYAEEWMMMIMGGWVATIPELPVKTGLGKVIWETARAADEFGKRLPELRCGRKSLTQSEAGNAGFAAFVQEIAAPERPDQTIEILDEIARKTRRHIEWGNAVLERLCDSEATRARRRARAEALRRQLIACGGATGELAPGSA